MKNNRVPFFLLLLLVIGCNQPPKEKKPISDTGIGTMEFHILDRTFGSSTNKEATELDTSKGYFLWIDLVVKNNGSSAIQFDSSFVRLTNEKGGSFSLSTDAIALIGLNNGECLHGASVGAHQEKKGFVVFNVPSIGNYTLQVNGTGNWDGGKREIEIVAGE